ncbi:MAG: O-antigen ligase family protein, partial [Candidatus Omnitrophica bacterium]|nr:O-antigen ligase family protein [Candidatus Omnitrophota bacterium]
ILRSSIPLNTIERIIEPSETETKTITTRFDWWRQSIEMGLSSPFFGIGLNNFYEYLSPKIKITNALFGSRNKLPQITATHPHSIFFQTFAETGFLGIISLTLLLGYFVKKDFEVFRKKNISCNLMIVSFWSLFLFGVFNPPITLQYIILFWFLRVLIIKLTKFPL